MDDDARFTEFTVDELKEQYAALLQHLYEVQQRHDEKQAILRGHEMEHMCTFRASNHKRFEEFVEQSVKTEAEDIGNTERDLSTIRRRLIQLGDNVSVSPTGSARSVGGGGVGISPRQNGSSGNSRKSPPPAERRYSPKRGRITRWRLKADDVRPVIDRASAEPSPGKSIAGSEGFRSRSRTIPRSPDPELDQYLDEHREKYRKEQEENLGKYGLPGVESE
ncbi:hypothetical protein M409DRAFT_19496 [Zasmidium cellare ATCC 36951]|uniref:Uncharacterized protein n=1 Tax=Zasmidium cellare ATCC 36951 TaxID=1080233 RepID=A0A6A6CUB2_ZASCE|nr:uncharacterized protein M409DRAFT_19496 [Zasmidium cellare ATCC 36951]KAF2170681.1 hypothetical protein M409DRAFT_19496 [Zasmidium cellare ATCC 36951]